MSKPALEYSPEEGIVPFRMVVLNEIKGLRGLLFLGFMIVVALILINVGLNATRIYLVDTRLATLRNQVSQMQHELDTKKCQARGK